MIFSEVCRKIAALRLVQASSGNYSQRSHFDSNELWVTESGVRLEDVNQPVKCSLREKKQYQGDFEPTSELQMHIAIYEKLSSIFCVLHYQPIYGTIIACSGKTIKDFNVIPEVLYYVKGIDYIPYLKPGSEELAKAVGDKIKKNEILILRNHGLVAIGTSQDELLKKVIFFEMACEILVKSPWELDRIK